MVITIFPLELKRLKSDGNLVCFLVRIVRQNSLNYRAAEVSEVRAVLYIYLWQPVICCDLEIQVI